MLHFVIFPTPKDKVKLIVLEKIQNKRLLFYLNNYYKCHIRFSPYYNWFQRIGFGQ